ncbi:MAG: branched-chain amino acid ABC transporter permease [Candidatus Methanomethylicia archaeon]
MSLLSIFLDTLISGIMIGAIYGLAGIGLSIVFGVLHIINFAIGEFIILGAYITFWLCILFNIHPLLAVLSSSFIMLLISFAAEKLTIEKIMKSEQFALATLLITYALSLLLRNLELILWTGDFRSIPIPPGYSFLISIGGSNVYFIRILTLIISMLTAIFLYLFFTRTMIGRAIRAVADDIETSQLMGISPKRIFLITFGLGGAVAGIAGSLFGMIYPFNPASAGVYGTKAFIVVVLGGMGSMLGAFVGGILLGIVEAFSGVIWLGGMKEVISYLMFIIVLMFRPTGLFRGRV